MLVQAKSPGENPAFHDHQKMLRVGRIDYLNIWPLFQGLKSLVQSTERLRLIPGHPSRLNALLFSGELDVAPSSSFEYLAHHENYSLLPDLSISSDGPVQSVFLACPFPFEKMPQRIAGQPQGLRVGLTSASASSTALLRVLWRFYWKWPEPQWIEVEPGHGLSMGMPFLEIGDMALRLACAPPPGWHLLDLGTAWKDFTGLPFVFGVWMVRENLSPGAERVLASVAQALGMAQQSFVASAQSAGQCFDRPAWLSSKALAGYWQCVSYQFGPREQAGLALFGRYACSLGLLPSMPGLRWKRLEAPSE